MKKVKTKNMTAIILSVLILFSGTAIALSGSEIALSGNKIELTVPSPLIETQWLADNINNVVLLDVRKKAKKKYRTNSKRCFSAMEKSTSKN